jgi:hypothetical protein
MVASGKLSLEYSTESEATYWYGSFTDPDWGFEQVSRD